MIEAEQLIRNFRAIGKKTLKFTNLFNHNIHEVEMQNYLDTKTTIKQKEDGSGGSYGIV